MEIAMLEQAFCGRIEKSSLAMREFLFNLLQSKTRPLFCFPLRAADSTPEQNDGRTVLSCRPAKVSSMNIKQYKELASMVEMAEENEGTLRFGAHYALKAYLKKNFGITTGDNKNTIKRARQLLDEFLTAYTSEDK
jgi:hypothetical protein